MHPCYVVGFRLGTGAVRMDKPLILRSSLPDSESSKVDQKSACKRCYNGRSLSIALVQKSTAFLHILGLPT